MPTPSEIYVYDGPDDVAEALASRLTAALADVQARGGDPQLCLTGGRIATKAYERLAQDGPGAVDWSRVDLWWGDERFVPAGDADRNADGTLAVLRAPLRLDDAFVHVMPASDAGLDLDAAAAAYAIELGDTVFDVCLLGVGPDGHVASLFPDHPSFDAGSRSASDGNPSGGVGGRPPSADAGSRSASDGNPSGGVGGRPPSGQSSVIAVRNSPKPPPDRISVTLEVIDRSRQVWFLVAGADKADAVAKGVLGLDEHPVPAALANGVDATVWLVDRAAAADLPDSVDRLEV